MLIWFIYSAMIPVWSRRYLFSFVLFAQRRSWGKHFIKSVSIKSVHYLWVRWWWTFFLYEPKPYLYNTQEPNPACTRSSFRAFPYTEGHRTVSSNNMYIFIVFWSTKLVFSFVSTVVFLPDFFYSENGASIFKPGNDLVKLVAIKFSEHSLWNVHCKALMCFTNSLLIFIGHFNLDPSCIIDTIWEVIIFSFFLFFKHFSKAYKIKQPIYYLALVVSKYPKVMCIDIQNWFILDAEKYN